MSERQAKLRRKNQDTKEVAKKKSKSDVVFNIVIVLLVVAVVGLGGWAVGTKYVQDAQMASTQTEGEEQAPVTIKQYAEAMGITTGQFMTEFGLDNNENINPETQMNDAIGYMTLENYAKLTGSTLEDAIKNFGLDAGVKGDTLMSEVDKMIKEKAEEAPKAE